MGLFGGKKSSEPTRREMAASRRQSASPGDIEAPTATSQAFRRSRNITNRPNIEESDRQGLHALRHKRRKVLTGLFSSFGLILIFGGLLGQLSASVVVETPDGGVRDSQDIQKRYSQVFLDYTAERPLERLRFMVNYDNLHAYFLEKAPEVQSVEVVSGDEIATSNLRISFRQPVLEWTSGGSKYYVDGQGVTFVQNHFDDPVTAVDDQSGVQAEPGQVVVNRSFLSFLGQVSAKFEDNGAKVSKVILPENTVRQVDFGLEGRDFVVRMTVDRGVEEQTNRALKAIGWLDEQGVAPSYIDARVDQRIFYK